MIISWCRFLCVLFSQGIANHTLRADYFTANNSVKSSPLILRVSYVEWMRGCCGPLAELSLFASSCCTPWMVGRRLAALGWFYHPVSPVHQPQRRPSLCPPPAALWGLMTNGCVVNQVLDAPLFFSIGKWVEIYDPTGEHIWWSGKRCWGFLSLGDPTLCMASTHRHLCGIEMGEDWDWNHQEKL